MFRERTRLVQQIGLMALILSGAATVPGCSSEEGPQRAAVRGVVTLDGTPLPLGVIQFIPDGETKGPSASASIQEGQFELPEISGPLIGTHRIEIQTRDPELPDPGDEQAVAAYIQKVQSRRRPFKKVELPAIYNRNSTLQETVTTDGPNKFEFNLVTKR